MALYILMVMYGCMAVWAVLLYCHTVGAGQCVSAVLPVYCQIRQIMLYEVVRPAALEKWRQQMQTAKRLASLL